MVLLQAAIGIFEAAIPPLPRQHPECARIAYACRRVARDAMAGLVEALPRPGDLVLARVETLGQITTLTGFDGRGIELACGDEIVVAYSGDSPTRPLVSLRLVTEDGLASWTPHSDMATRLTPKGLVADPKGNILNLADWALKPRLLGSRIPALFAVIDTASTGQDASSAGQLVRGLVGAGLRVGAARVTGSGAACAVAALHAAGASPLYDFTDGGVVATDTLTRAEIERVFLTLFSQIAATRVDAMVFELAGHPFREDTRALLGSPCFIEAVDGLLFAAHNALDATAGLAWLAHQPLPLLAVTGTPLALQAAGQFTPLPTLAPAQLRHPDTVRALGLTKRLPCLM